MCFKPTYWSVKTEQARFFVAVKSVLQHCQEKDYNELITTNKKIEWLLRVGVAGEFVGHGLLGIGGKKDWIDWISQLPFPALMCRLYLGY